MYTRNQQRSGGNQRPSRYNKPGTFIPGGQQHNNQQHNNQQHNNQQQYDNQQHHNVQQHNNQRNNDFNDPPPLPVQGDANISDTTHEVQQLQSLPPPVVQQQEMEVPPLPPLPPQPPQQEYIDDQGDQTMDLPSDPLNDSMDSSTHKKPWMKPKGLYKISNKERRRRMNVRLTKVLVPKNALMVLNEMNNGDVKFAVEPVVKDESFNDSRAIGQFMATLTADGNEYKGYALSKVMARNDAAEQAIRDLILKKMEKQNIKLETASVAESKNSADLTNDGNGDVEMTSEEDEPLPMLKLASFALHKLFNEWQAEGFTIPVLKDKQSLAGSVAGSDVAGVDDKLPKAKKAKEPKPLPADAASMHPCMLLTQMRTGIEYQEISVEGDKPQNMMFTMGINIEGATYIGRASNKKEARKNAARAACQSLFEVQYNDSQNQSVKLQ